MAQPRFRFLDGASLTVGDDQFWRDAEASERLSSPAKADLYLRELCRTKAREGQELGVGGDATSTCSARERALLRAAHARGYRLSGPDLSA